MQWLIASESGDAEQLCHSLSRSHMLLIPPHRPAGRAPCRRRGGRTGRFGRPAAQCGVAGRQAMDRRGDRHGGLRSLCLRRLADDHSQPDPDHVCVHAAPRGSAIARQGAERAADGEVERPRDDHLQVGSRHAVPRQHRHRGRSGSFDTGAALELTDATRISIGRPPARPFTRKKYAGTSLLETSTADDVPPAAELYEAPLPSDVGTMSGDRKEFAYWLLGGVVLNCDARRQWTMRAP